MDDLTNFIDRGEPIPASRITPHGNDGRKCEFCKGPQHFGFCDALREYQSWAAKNGKPRPNPLVR